MDKGGEQVSLPPHWVTHGVSLATVLCNDASLRLRTPMST